MHQLVLYVLGQKGYQVLSAATIGNCKDNLHFVVVGRDENVQQDFANEIVDFCKKNDINCCERNCLISLENPQNYIAVAAGWRWIINENYRQIIVFHDSLLPKYRGFNPLVTALLNKDLETGVTAIIANKDFDRGDIVDSKSLRINYPIKIKNIIDSVSALYFELAKSIFSKIIKNEYLDGAPQDEEKASYSVWRDDEDYRINWNNSAESINHFINCLSFPYKGASTLYNKKLIRILEAEIVPDVKIANRDTGKVLFVSEKKPVIICRTGLLRINVAIDDKGCSVLPFKKFRTRLK